MFFPSLFHGTRTILFAVWEISQIKLKSKYQKCLILESNRELANGLSDMCISLINQSIFYVVFYPNEALTWNEDDEIGAKLKSNCHAVGLAFSDETPRDGSCFFHAVSSQLGRLGLDEKEPLQLRIEIVDYLKENRKFEVKSYPKDIH